MPQAPVTRARELCGDEQARSFGCEPAKFSGELATLRNVTMVLWEADGDEDDKTACEPSRLDRDEALTKYGGKAVMLMRGKCTFEQKWLTLSDLNAAAMIVVQNIAGAFPIGMMMTEESENAKYNNHNYMRNGVGIPACMTFSDQWERFASLSSVRVTLDQVKKYRFEDEHVPRNDITGRALPDSFEALPSMLCLLCVGLGSRRV